MIQNTQYGMIVRQFCNLTGGADSLPQKKTCAVQYNLSYTCFWAILTSYRTICA